MLKSSVLRVGVKTLYACGSEDVVQYNTIQYFGIKTHSIRNNRRKLSFNFKIFIIMLIT